MRTSSPDCARPTPRQRLARLAVLAIGSLALTIWSPFTALGQGPPRPDADSKGKLPRRIFVRSIGPPNPLRGLIAIDPNAGTWQKVLEELGGSLRLSPDGTSIAVDKNEKDRTTTWIYDIRGEKEPVLLFDPEEPLVSMVKCWSPDGRELFLTTFHPASGKGNELWRVSADGSKKERLPIPETERVVVWDWSADGRWLVTSSPPRPGGGAGPGESEPASVCMMHPDGTGKRILWPSKEAVPDGEARSIAYAHFSPDGRKLVWSEGLISEDQRRTWRVAVFNIEGSRWRPLFRGEAGKAFVGACWSPDGRWIASTSFVNEPGEERYRIEIVDPEGEQVRPIPLPVTGGTATLIDWR